MSRTDVPGQKIASGKVCNRLAVKTDLGEQDSKICGAVSEVVRYGAVSEVVRSVGENVQVRDTSQ